MQKPITMTSVSARNRDKSSGALQIFDIFINQIGQLHLTLEDKDGNLFDTDVENSHPVLTLKQNRADNPPPILYVKDGPPRVPAIGDTIKVGGNFVKAKKLSTTAIKKQIYIPAETNEQESKSN